MTVSPMPADEQATPISVKPVISGTPRRSGTRPGPTRPSGSRPAPSNVGALPPGPPGGPAPAGLRLPKYYQVKKQLLDLTSSMAPGSPVPPERELARLYETSRTT